MRFLALVPSVTPNMLIVGAVASYLNVNDLLPWFPARSAAVAVTDALTLSGPLKVAGDDTDTTPDPEPSLALKVSETGLVYQPFESGDRSNEALMSGGVVS